MSYIGNTPVNQNFVAGADQFSGTGSQTVFTLSRNVNTVFDMFVTVSNVPQDPFTAYTVAGNTLTFDGAPPSGTNNIDVVYRATNVQTFVPTPGVSTQLGLGSAAAPSLTFIGDTNTGIYSPGADTVAIAAGGTQKALFGTGSATIDGLTVGRGAGAVATNTAVGASALAATTGSSSNNTAVGSAAGSSLTSGARNTALGFNALLLNTTGTENTAVGGNALNKSTTPSNNTAVGYVALFETTTGANNTALGAQALQNNTTANNNTAVGYQAGYGNTTGLGNTIMGYQAGYTVGAGNNYNTFIGYQAGYAAARTSGNAVNTAIGYAAGSGLTDGFYNTFIGPSSGSSVTTGTKNTILGGYNGNQGGLDIRTASNYIVMSDGDGNPRGWWDNNGNHYVTPNMIVNRAQSPIGANGNGGAFVTLITGSTFGLQSYGTISVIGSENGTVNTVFYQINFSKSGTGITTYSGLNGVALSSVGGTISGNGNGQISFQQSGSDLQVRSATFLAIQVRFQITVNNYAS